MSAPLQLFHPVISRWFSERVGLPTPPQEMGWPHIAAGKSTLILAPTGSGKTLAAFLAAIDTVAKKLLEHPGEMLGTHILYVSPLKALANDVQKNLLRPLADMADVARTMKTPWPEITVGLRTGDTPARERAALIKSPPHILITTPESLNLMLTSAARTTLRGVQYVIVDEVHSLAGNKRGVFLSILLERLESERTQSSPAGRQRIAPGVYVSSQPPHPLVRIGLSATARPEEEIAHWLAGYDEQGDPRPIEIVRAGQRKRLDLAVECPFPPAWERTEEDGTSNNPFVARRVLQLIREHHSTIVFSNARRLVERMAAMIQEELTGEKESDIPRILPHHGSIDKQVRLQTEEALKTGKLSAVIATSSLELGIDVGALDLVIQLDSPGSVAAGLQRVGRAGHLEKATARGRLLARTLNDLPPLAGIVPLMLKGEVEETRIIKNPLDVLAQQVVAACSVQTWPREDLFKLFRRSTCYASLPEKQFDSVLTMLSKKTEAANAAGLRPRISFDRVNDRLIALPVSRKLATINGGVIADTGQFPVYLAGTEPAKNDTESTGRKPVRIGELDEEFVFETREHDNIVLGSQVWEVISITDDRVLVARAEPKGNIRMPFWRGEGAARSELLGRAIAQFNDECESHLASGVEPTREWLIRDHHFDDRASDALIDLYQRQLAHASLPTSKRIVIEHFTDRVGEPMISILCPLGSRVNHVLRLALEAAFAQRRIPAQMLHHDDGVIIRPPGQSSAIPENPLAWLRSDLLHDDVLHQLEGSPLFGLRFRQNAARALMLPRVSPTQRTPLWQQRLRARHLLALVQQQRNFPVVVETYRECLQDVLQIAQAESLLRALEHGDVKVHVTRGKHASPMTHTLLGIFEGEFLYQGDTPLQGSDPSATVDPAILDQILNRKMDSSPGEIPWSDQDVTVLQRRITGEDFPARTLEELLERIDAYGLVPLGAPSDSAWSTWVVEDAPAMLKELLESRRLVLVSWKPKDQFRWLATESLALVLAAIGDAKLFTYRGDDLVPLTRDALPAAMLHTDLSTDDARQRLVEQALKRLAITSLAELQELFAPFATAVKKIVTHLIQSGAVVTVGAGTGQLALAEHVDQLRMIALRRQRQIAAVSDIAGLQRHLLRWHDMADPRSGPDALEDSLDRLSGLVAPISAWQYDLLPARVRDFAPTMLDGLITQGYWVCVGHPEEGVSFLPRHQLADLPPKRETPLSPDASLVLDYLRRHGASFHADLDISLPQLAGPVILALQELFNLRWITNDLLEPLAKLATQSEQARTAEQRHAVPSEPHDQLRRYPNNFDFRRRADLRHPRRVSGLSLGGRWFVLPGAMMTHPQPDPATLAQQAADRVERLLRRNGFACRELTDPEVDGPWRQCYQVLTRMEWAGAVRRGYFIEGIGGSQFAAGGVDFWAETAANADVVWLSMLDPANVYARIPMSWPTINDEPARVPRVQGSWLALIAGRPVLAAVSWGQRLIPLTTDDPSLQRAIAAVSQLLHRLPPETARVLSVKYWSHQDIIGSPAEATLHSSGFSRDPQGLKLYRQY